MTKPISRKMAVDCLLWRFAANCAAMKRKDCLDPDIAWLWCGECGGHILAGQDIQFDHIHAMVHEGPHEYQNLRPIHAECHKKKSARDVAAKAKGDRILGLTCNKPKKKIPSRPWPKRA